MQVQRGDQHAEALLVVCSKLLQHGTSHVPDIAFAYGAQRSISSVCTGQGRSRLWRLSLFERKPQEVFDLDVSHKLYCSHLDWYIA